MLFFQLPGTDGTGVSESSSFPRQEKGRKSGFGNHSCRRSGIPGNAENHEEGNGASAFRPCHKKKEKPRRQNVIRRVP